MKRIIIALVLACLTIFVVQSTLIAQDDDMEASAENTEMEDTTMEEAPAEEIVPEEPVAEVPVAATMVEEEAGPPPGLHHRLKTKFIEGDPLWMTPVLLCLILGLGMCIERIISIGLATTNTEALLSSIEGALQSGDAETAKEICKSTRGPIASIFYQGLQRKDEGLGAVEKAIVSYGSVQMSLLEKGLVWISLFISLAPMLGFMGTVIGMIAAFDSIETQGDISPALVAGGIKVALLTTVFGLIVAITLQIFYNYIVTKIDDIVHNMEDASISFVDLLVSSNTVKGS